jgi:hypothetical protein
VIRSTLPVRVSSADSVILFRVQRSRRWDQAGS